MLQLRTARYRDQERLVRQALEQRPNHRGRRIVEPLRIVHQQSQWALPCQSLEHLEHRHANAIPNPSRVAHCRLGCALEEHPEVSSEVVRAARSACALGQLRDRSLLYHRRRRGIEPSELAQQTAKGSHLRALITRRESRTSESRRFLAFAPLAL